MTSYGSLRTFVASDPEEGRRQAMALWRGNPWGSPSRFSSPRMAQILGILAGFVTARIDLFWRFKGTMTSDLSFRAAGP
jgi:hypothetical protein